MDYNKALTEARTEQSVVPKDHKTNVVSAHQLGEGLRDSMSLNYIKSYNAFIQDLSLYSKIDLLKIGIGYNIPYVSKEQFIQVLANMLLLKHYPKIGQMNSATKEKIDELVELSNKIVKEQEHEKDINRKRRIDALDIDDLFSDLEIKTRQFKKPVRKLKKLT